MRPRSWSSRSSALCTTEVPNWLARSSPSSGRPAASNLLITCGSRAIGSAVVLMKATPALHAASAYARAISGRPLGAE